MLPFGVTIPATVLQRSKITEGLMNYSVCYWLEGFSKYEAKLTILLNLLTIFPYLKNRLQDFGEEGRTETVHDSVTVLGTARVRAGKFLIVNCTLDASLELA
jgi:hypothetical protein